MVRCLYVCVWFVNIWVCYHVKMFCVTRRGDCLDDSQGEGVAVNEKTRAISVAAHINI